MKKRLGNVKRVATFAPAISEKFIRNLENKSKKNFEKKLKKDLDCKG
ncbi:hypothetical protein [Flavobacterium sp.]